MSDVMRPLPFGRLMEWILKEYADNKSIFGVRKFVRYSGEDSGKIFKERLESPFGPAAGPNTQLSQNIIASYVAGSRFFELKTVQKMDGEELSKCVSKPCITAGDECYNCEWSTELTVPQAFKEYVNAYVALKLISREFGFGDPDAFVFNMSVGYDLEGIKTEKVDSFIENMKEAKDTEAFKEAIDWTLKNLDKFEKVDEAYVKGISSNISASITESTLHGCPPDEIERIATYLISEKGLNTYIKCNPTLLGYEFARKKLDSLGFDYIAFDDHHFKEDLQWADAVPMFKRLIALAGEKGLEFGVKLTNTFPVDVKAGELPSEEMYMAGRSLFPLTVHLARLISEEFEGKLRISYSGGAVLQNIGKLYKAGIWPITMATNILKPGGYERLVQIGEALKGGEKEFKGVDISLLSALDEGVDTDPLYRKNIKPLPERHMDKKLPLFSCFTSPCREGCPINQDIPAYLKALEDGDSAKAFRIIIERNPLPFITGTICPHHCADKCMRNYYEEGLHIRESKLSAAKAAYEEILPSIKSPDKDYDKKTAIVGGGPAGLAAAYFLTREGIPATIFEKEDTLGGVIRKAIPGFRISDDAVEKDKSLCLSYGAEVKTGTEVKSLNELKDAGYKNIIIATGAEKPGNAGLKYGEETDALEFLIKAKNDPDSLNPGKNVVVIGGGNTAMDTARAAKRIKGVEKVMLVYRRTRRYMPADEEELNEAIKDGVEFMELLAPIGVKDGTLECSVMKLGEPDESGRRSPVDTGEKKNIPADMVIAAVGEKVDTELYASFGIAADKKGRPETDKDMLSNVPGVYVIGDGRRGPATVVEAIADAARAAAAISGADYDKYVNDNKAGTLGSCLERKGVMVTDTEGLPDKRCLGCETVCAVCADVCPNRANILLNIPGQAGGEILHMDEMCNECGNCAVFCPYDGAPYKDKFTLFGSEEDFNASENQGFVKLDKDSYLIRIDKKTEKLSLEEIGKISPEAKAVIKASESFFGK